MPRRARAAIPRGKGEYPNGVTRPYAPPEQYGFGQTSVRSDVYALGALLFFCLTGADPKPGRDMREQCEMRDIPASLTDAVCMSMALDPAKRFASAEALGRTTRSAYDLSRPVRPPTPAPVRTPASETVLTLQGLQNPAGLPRPAASAACGLLSRVPESLGRIWNALVCFSLLVFFAGSHFAVFHPTGANQSYPTWLLIIEYFFFVDGLMVLMHFALLDKRRLRRRQPSRQEARETLAQGIGCAAPMHDRHSRGCQCDRRHRYFRHLKEKGPIGALCSCT